MSSSTLETRSKSKFLNQYLIHIRYMHIIMKENFVTNVTVCIHHAGRLSQFVCHQSMMCHSDLAMD